MASPVASNCFSDSSPRNATASTERSTRATKPTTRPMATLAPVDIPGVRGGPTGGVLHVSTGGTAGAWSGGYHLPSEASHHPGPCDCSLMTDLSWRDPTMPPMSIRAAFFDFGGVILSSPFEAFNGFEER